MVRFCRGCQKNKPHDAFHPNGRCRACLREGRGPQLVRVTLPVGWSSPHAGLPDMTVPTEAELEAGYEGDLWAATKGPWRVEVRWRGDLCRYRCRVVKDDDVERPKEDRTFVYPHEVVEWVGAVFVRLACAYP